MPNSEFSPAGSIERCRCCMGKTTYFSTAKILDFTATYSICSKCSSIQVDDPVWIERAHSKAISNLDTGLVSRCLSASRLISTLLFLEGKRWQRELTGVEVRVYLCDYYGIKASKFAVTINLLRQNTRKDLRRHSKRQRKRPHFIID